MRIVRAPDGSCSVDPTGRSDGRGAYLCLDEACWQLATKRGILAKHLRTAIDATTLGSLGRQVAEARTHVSASSIITKDGS